MGKESGEGIPQAAREWLAPVDSGVEVIETTKKYGDEVIDAEIEQVEGAVMPKGMGELSSDDSPASIAARGQYVRELAALHGIKDLAVMDRMATAAKTWVGLVEKGTDPKIAETALLKVAGRSVRDIQEGRARAA